MAKITRADKHLIAPGSLAGTVVQALRRIGPARAAELAQIAAPHLKPVTVSNAQHFAARVSRHAEPEEGVRSPKESLGRVSSQMDEICVAFREEGDDPLTLATLVHRRRGAHAQYDADTARPFPLNELRKLGGVTF
ncbi:RNaseH domain-containing protein [Bradyrhizobium sp. RDT46]|uniref:RNaseH domain-containing protein n=1 Tax=Bradyrhizobium sp. RDT46 TaxID=3341829 RepID=UPI0035C74D83